MKTYIVHVKEVWNQPMEIEADSEKEAKEKVADCDGMVLENRFEYSHSLDIETWEGEEICTCK